MPRLDPQSVRRLELDSSDPNTLYLGHAPLDALTSDPVWRISKIDVSTAAIKMQYAFSGQYTGIWDNRLTYTYK